MEEKDYKKLYEEALERANVEQETYFKLGNISAKTAIERIFPELCKNEDEKIRKAIIKMITEINGGFPFEKYGIIKKNALTWLEKQGEQKLTQETEPFEAEHGKYYYCIKDYFCGGKKQASKGDVVQALRGLPIMGLKDASEYFLPVNFIKCNSAWSEEDEMFLFNIIKDLEGLKNESKIEQLKDVYYNEIDWLKSLKPQNRWKPSEEQMEAFAIAVHDAHEHSYYKNLFSLYNDIKKLNSHGTI